jgi:hypothetical protein
MRDVTKMLELVELSNTWLSSPARSLPSLPPSPALRPVPDHLNLTMPDNLGKHVKELGLGSLLVESVASEGRPA